MKKKKLCKFLIVEHTIQTSRIETKEKRGKKPDTQVYLQWGCRREYKYIKKYNKKAKEKDQKKVCVFLRRKKIRKLW